MMSLKRFALFVAASLAAGAAAGQENQTNEEQKPAAAPEVEVHELTIHGAAETRPALRDHLLPSSLEQTAQNAAPVYMRAFLLQANTTSNQKDQQRISELIELPLDKLPVDEARELLTRYHNSLSEAHTAARRETCDWGLPIQESGADLFGILLPDVQDARSLGRLLTLKARLQIAEGKHAEALHTLRTLFALSRHVGQQPFLVSGLVGAAIANQGLGELEQFVQTKDAPNLYWPLTNLPRPLVDLRPGVHLEYSSVYRVFPELKDARTGDYTDAEWNARAVRMLARQRNLLTEQSGEEETPWWAKLADAAVFGVASASAGERLVEHGYSAEDVKKMPPGRILLLDMAVGFDEVRDDVYKAFGLPYPQAAPIMNAAGREMNKHKREGIGGALAALLLPAMTAVKSAEVRSQANVDVLRCIEALRIYVAAHGELPAKLDDIKEVPVPTNPRTGEPFRYKLEDGVATLDLEDDGRPIEFRIRLAK